MSFLLGLGSCLETNPGATPTMDKEPDGISPPNWANLPVAMLESSINHPSTGIVKALRFLWGVAVRGRPAWGSLFYVHFWGLRQTKDPPERMMRMKRALGTISWDEQLKEGGYYSRACHQNWKGKDVSPEKFLKHMKPQKPFEKYELIVSFVSEARVLRRHDLWRLL